MLLRRELIAKRGHGRSSDSARSAAARYSWEFLVTVRVMRGWCAKFEGIVGTVQQ